MNGALVPPTLVEKITRNVENIPDTAIMFPLEAREVLVLLNGVLHGEHFIEMQADMLKKVLANYDKVVEVMQTSDVIDKETYLTFKQGIDEFQTLVKQMDAYLESKIKQNETEW